MKIPKAQLKKSKKTKKKTWQIYITSPKLKSRTHKTSYSIIISVQVFSCWAHVCINKWTPVLIDRIARTRLGWLLWLAALAGIGYVYICPTLLYPTQMKSQIRRLIMVGPKVARV